VGSFTGAGRELVAAYLAYLCAVMYGVEMVGLCLHVKRFLPHNTKEIPIHIRPEGPTVDSHVREGVARDN